MQEIRGLVVKAPCWDAGNLGCLLIAATGFLRDLQREFKSQAPFICCCHKARCNGKSAMEIKTSSLAFPLRFLCAPTGHSAVSPPVLGAHGTPLECVTCMSKCPRAWCSGRHVSRALLRAFLGQCQRKKRLFCKKQ